MLGQNGRLLYDHQFTKTNLPKAAYKQYLKKLKSNATELIRQSQRTKSEASVANPLTKDKVVKELNEGLSGSFTISVTDHANIIQGLANLHSHLPACNSANATINLLIYAIICVIVYSLPAIQARESTVIAHYV